MTGWGGKGRGKFGDAVHDNIFQFLKTNEERPFGIQVLDLTQAHIIMSKTFVFSEQEKLRNDVATTQKDNEILKDQLAQTKDKVIEQGIMIGQLVSYNREMKIQLNELEEKQGALVTTVAQQTKALSTTQTSLSAIQQKKPALFATSALFRMGFFPSVNQTISVMQQPGHIGNSLNRSKESDENDHSEIIELA